MRNYIDELTITSNILKGTCDQYFNYDSTSVSFVANHEMDLQQVLIQRIKQSFDGDMVVSHIDPDEINIAGHRTWTVECGGANHHIERNSKFFGIQISLIEGKDIVLAIIYLPFLDEMYTATLGGGAYMNGHQINVQPRSVRNASVCFGTFNNEVEELAACQLLMIKNLRVDLQEVMMFGSNAVSFAYVASGKINGLINFSNDVSAINPGILLCQEAGAIVSNIEGKNYDYSNSNVVVADSSDLLATIKTATIEREAKGDHADSRIRIGYIGLPGDLAEQAANIFANQQKFRFVDLIPSTDVRQIIRDMQIRKIDFAVLPIRTTNNAIYTEVSDQLSRIRHEHVDTVSVPVSLNLYKRTKNVSNGDLIDVVCENAYYSFVDTKLRLLLPRVARQTCENSSIAAKDLRDDKYNDRTAVICSEAAGEFNRLALVRENLIADDLADKAAIEYRCIRYQG